MSHIVIAGGGIAGPTTALALHEMGFRDVVILERSPSLKPLGSGINLMPPAVRELDRLGVLEDLRKISIETANLLYATPDGEKIWEERRGLAAGFRWPQLSIHRGWLQSQLTRHVRDRLGEDAIRTGAEVTGVVSHQDISGARVHWRDRETDTARTLDADLLIGADGIRSTARRLVAPTDPGPRQTGQVVWRGMAWQPRSHEERTMVIAGDQEHKVVFYPIAHDGDASLINWAAAGPMRAQDEDEQGNWNVPVPPEVFAPRFDSWHIGGIDIAALMRGSDKCFAYPMVDLDPLDHWSKGSVTLVGDAAHAMYPVGSNGATQSIVDAAALAYHLAVTPTIPAGLAAYERERLPKTRQIQAANRELGPEVVINMAATRRPHVHGPVAQAFQPGELEAVAARYAKTTALSEANADSCYHLPVATPSTQGERNPT